MKKRYMLALAGAGVAGYFLNREKMRGLAKTKTGRFDTEGDGKSTLDLAGAPDQVENEDHDIAQLENAKMVSEGSRYGVHYYNDIKNAGEGEVH